MNITLVAKIVGLVTLLVTPLSASLWWSSHSFPQHRRYDVTPFKSLRVLLGSGVCHLRLLDMPAKSSLRSQFISSLGNRSMIPPQSLGFSTFRQGHHRITLLTFPLWASTGILASTGFGLLFAGPLIRWRRDLKGWCIRCGYDLRGSRAGRCPECGMRYARAKRRR